jgi:hypothetical protein
MDQAASGESPSHYQASLSDLRASLRWLVASSGAVVAVIVTGLQLRDISAIGGVWRVAASSLAAAAALGIVLGLLVQAARVLTLPRPTATELSNREIEAGAVTSAPRLEPTRDGLVNSILARRTYLLGEAKTVTELYTNEYVASIHALRGLESGQALNWQGRRLDPDSAADRSIVSDALRQAEKRLAMTEDAAHLFQTEEKYRNLLDKFKLGASCFLLALITFALTASPTKPPDRALVPASVAAPVAVRVVVVDASRSGLPKRCTSDEYRGVAVAGNLATPTVALEPTSDCGARIVKPNKGLVVVPIVQPKTS